MLLPATAAVLQQDRQHTRTASTLLKIDLRSEIWGHRAVAISLVSKVRPTTRRAGASARCQSQTDWYGRRNRTAIAPKGDGETKSPDGETELLALMRRITERLDRLEESQAKLEKTLEGDRAKHESKVDPILTPPMNTNLFVSSLGRGARMHIDQLSGSPRTPSTRSPHGYGGELSELQRLYAAAQAQAQQPPPPAPLHHAATAQPGVGQQAIRYPDARQKKLAIRAFNGKELHGRAILQQAGRRLVVADANVAYASADLRTVLTAKVDGTRTDYVQQSEELAHFAQSWELETKNKNIEKEMVGAVGHLRAACPGTQGGGVADSTLTVNEVNMAAEKVWILDSGSSRHLVNDASWLEDVEPRAHSR
ncbi:hypothetical protein ON010_g8707 [Phytophthora cinnamomi]|nr:hypothetical protein ON010_g8707 [Phytophthora cinnamomi]